MLQSEMDRHAVRLSVVLEREIENARSTHDNALVRLERPLPDVDVLADDMLESVFRNLLTNAVRHNDKEVPEVIVLVDRHNEGVLVRIADNGPGIPDERKAEIFEQGEMGLDSDGTGLGLYLVDVLVDRYGEDDEQANARETLQVYVRDEDGSVLTVRRTSSPGSWLTIRTPTWRHSARRSPARAARSCARSSGRRSSAVTTPAFSCPPTTRRGPPTPRGCD